MSRILIVTAAAAMLMAGQAFAQGNSMSSNTMSGGNAMSSHNAMHADHNCTKAMSGGAMSGGAMASHNAMSSHNSMSSNAMTAGPKNCDKPAMNHMSSPNNSMGH